MDGECVYGRKTNTYKAMVRKRERRTLLGIPIGSLEDIIKMELNEVLRECPE
jgi:hypothetical protein